MHERPSTVSVCVCNSSNMSFLDIKDPAKRTALVDDNVKAMRTVRRRNMVNREMKLAIGEELQTLFHPVVSATKQAAEESIRGYRWNFESPTTYHRQTATITTVTTTEGSHIWYTCNR